MMPYFCSMIKRILLALVLIGLTGHLRAQGNNSFHVGVGSISNFYPIKHKDKIYQGTGIGTGIRLGYEQRVKDLSTGNLSLGGILVFGRSSANYSFDNWKSKYHWRHTVLAARVTYEYPIDEQLNLYGGLHVGFQFERFNQSFGATAPPAAYRQDNYFHSSPYTGLFFGADYKVSEKFGAFAELGYDLMWFTLGAKVYL